MELHIHAAWTRFIFGVCLAKKRERAAISTSGWFDDMGEISLVLFGVEVFHLVAAARMLGMLAEVIVASMRDSFEFAESRR